MTPAFDHLPPNNRKALNSLLTRLQQTINELRRDRRRLARDNDRLKAELAETRAKQARTLADAIAEQVGASSAQVRRTMYAGGVLYDGEQVRDPLEPAKPYAGRTVFYGRRSTPVFISEAERGA